MTGNHSATENYYPELTYALTVDKSFQVTDSTLFGGAEADLLVLAIEKDPKKFFTTYYRAAQRTKH
ncbi:hypothetical protein JG559_10680 [Enterococcus faecalis]|uniref:Uncharacterized protein n=1 Tax=Enterococcus faecalis TaxID=1351 RepID=A0A974NYP3_ENTFL|nr:hypothetical protein JG559_10680 [Enterococcus faecalis]